MKGQDNIIGIVDDDAAVRRALGRLLSTMGFAVAAYASAEELLASGVACRLRCLLIDVQLRNMSGVELHARLKTSRRDLPIIFISAAGDAGSLVRATWGPGVAVLKKPFEADRLRDLLAHRLPRPGSA